MLRCDEISQGRSASSYSYVNYCSAVSDKCHADEKFAGGIVGL